MYHTVTYATSFGDNMITNFERDESGLLMVPDKFLFKSKSFTEANE